MMARLLLVYLSCAVSLIYAIKYEPIPIQFSIPECKIVTSIPAKLVDFATIIPGNLSTYIYQDESSYYQGYQQAYFGVTCKKSGWDCLRHYEILANGCIPYFVDLDQCPEKTMSFFPKELLKKAMALPGVSYLSIDHTVFDKQRYYALLHELIDYTRKHLTTKSMATYFLNKINYVGTGTILFLSGETYPDYLRCLTLIGLKEVLGARVVDVPKIEHIYRSYKKNVRNLYGKGCSYTKVIKDFPVDRENIENRIRNKEFDVVIYGSVHRGLPLYDLVYAHYPPEKIVYLCGEDLHECSYKYWLQNLFLRES